MPVMNDFEASKKRVLFIKRMLSYGVAKIGMSLLGGGLKVIV